MTVDLTQYLREGGGFSAVKKPVAVLGRPITQPEAIRTREGVVVAESGDWALTDEAGNEWPVSDAHLHEYYESLAPDQDRRASRWVARPIRVRAIKLDEPLSVPVGRHQSLIQGHPDDWLIYYSNGSFGIVAASLFHDLYQLNNQNHVDLP